jgi:hypothetical protein
MRETASVSAESLGCFTEVLCLVLRAVSIDQLRMMRPGRERSELTSLLSGWEKSLGKAIKETANVVGRRGLVVGPVQDLICCAVNIRVL